MGCSDELKILVINININYQTDCYRLKILFEYILTIFQ